MNWVAEINLRSAEAADIARVLSVWRVAAEDAHRPPDTAAEGRFRVLGGTRVDAMVLYGNELADRVWRAAGYTRQAEWSRWVKPL